MSDNKNIPLTSADSATATTVKLGRQAGRAQPGIAGLSLLLAALCGPASAAAHHEVAESAVKNQPCANGETVDQFLNHSLKSSHRDLGWRVFERDGGFDVERTFLASKSMELRYRWRVEARATPKPISGRAEHLCS